MFTPEALKRATSRIASTSSWGTAVGKKALTLRRDMIAQSTVRWVSCADSGGGDKRFKIRILLAGSVQGESSAGQGR
jgi:hypothetical protein